MDDINQNSGSSNDDESDTDLGGRKSAIVSKTRTFVMNSTFDFDLGLQSNHASAGKPLDSWNFATLRSTQEQQKRSNSTSVAQKISNLLQQKERRQRLITVVKPEVEESDADSDSDNVSESDEDTHDDSVSDYGNAVVKAKGRVAAQQTVYDANTSEELGTVRDISKLVPTVLGRPDRVPFSALNLSKPLLRAVADLGFETATPIQAATIPIAMSGTDILANAVTGSGKTGAFILPILERLLYRPRKVPMLRVVVLAPTRELAAQCHSMTENLARHTDIRCCLIVGGLSMQSQEAALRQSPDICIATPGRLIDHLRNTQSVHLEDVEILVLDEADRLLEMGFVDEVKEIVRHCPRGRQTMLFSATLSDQVNDLANLSLHNPKKIAVDALYSLADHLTQEFIRIRPSHEHDREAIVLSLCRRSFHSRVMLFFKSKAHCHRMAIVFGLAKLNCAELHGNLTQTQRLEALDKFRDGTVDFLLCTDLAARGLDVKGVETVINYYFPPELTSYIHRVGRTARAGQDGRSVTLVGEQQRQLLKEVVKRAPSSVKSRLLPDTVIEEFRSEIQAMENDIREIFHQERLEKDLRVAEMQVNKANNVMVHQQEIYSRPKKTWFQTEKEKQAAKLSGKPEDDEEESNVHESAAAKKLKRQQLRRDATSANDGDESDDKSDIKRDPYAGMSRKQRRRRQMNDQETKEFAQMEAEAKMALRNKKANARTSGDGDVEGGGEVEDESASGKAAPRRVKVSKQDLAAAASKLEFKRAGEKLMAKSIKRGVQQDKLNADEMDDNNGRGANDEGVDPSMDGGNLSRKQAMKRKKATNDEAAEIRFGKKRKDPDSFSARYRNTRDDDTKVFKGKKSDGKTFRVKSNQAFKSKSRYKRH